MLKDKMAEVVAEYFTDDSLVAQYSMSLAPSNHGAQLAARKFFAARQALGIVGYASKDEALEVLNSQSRGPKGASNLLSALSEKG